MTKKIIGNGIDVSYAQGRIDWTKLKGKIDFSGKTYYYLFSLSGFTDAVIQVSNTDDRLFLIDAAQLVSI